MTTLEQRLAVLRDILTVARGRLAAAQEQVAEEQSGVYQIEGRILEIQDVIEAGPLDNKEDPGTVEATTLDAVMRKKPKKGAI